MKKVAVVGEGAWGSAIASVLADNGHQVNLWCHDAHVCEEITTQRSNQRYLPGFLYHQNIIPSPHMNVVLEGVDVVFIAIPVMFLRSVLQSMQPYVTADTHIVLLSKGIEEKTLLLPSELARDVLNVANISVVMGPSFAHEVMLKQTTGVVVASDQPASAQQTIELLQNDYFKTVYSTDLVGVQLCAALKNVIALGVGILQGAGYGENTVAFFITRALQEMAQLVTVYGGLPETVYGLAGVGDVLLTATGSRSKNNYIGRKLGAGLSLSDSIQHVGSRPEGVNTVLSLHELCNKKNQTCSLLESVFQVVHGDAPPNDIVVLLS